MRKFNSFIFKMISVIGVLCALSLASAQQLNPIHEWNLVKYNLPDAHYGNITYTDSKALIFRFEIVSDRIFLSIPKAFGQNAPSLVSIPKYSSELAPTFEAYPNWDWHSEPGCDGIFSAFTLRLDTCGRLWVLDAGLTGIGRDLMFVCPPKLVAFDVNTNQEVKRIEIPSGVLTASSTILNFVFDDSDERGYQPPENCDSGYIYFADVRAPAIVVYDFVANAFWRHSDPALYPNPLYSKTSSGKDANAGVVINMAGVSTMTLSSPGPQRELFVAPLSDTTVYAIPTAALKQRPSTARNAGLPINRVFNKGSQGATLIFDPFEEALLFTPTQERALIKYKLSTEDFSVVAQDEALIWAEDCKIVSSDENSIWLLSNSFCRWWNKNVNPHEVNMRLFRVDRGYSPGTVKGTN